MVWFDDSGRMRLCEAGFCGYFAKNAQPGSSGFSGFTDMPVKPCFAGFSGYAAKQ
jgi:hypothetical protein